MTKIVIIGGGFGGLHAAKALKNARVEIALIDRRNFHLFQPLLYQVATGGLSPADIAHPLRSVFKKQPNVKVVLGEVIDVDMKQQTVKLQNREIHYDYLILASGSHHHYFGNDDWERFAPGLKTIEDATAIRSRILSAFEQAELEMDPAKRQALLTFAIVGGGPTGIELAGTIAELANETLRNEFRKINPSHARIIVLEAGGHILSSYPEESSIKAEKALQQLHVEILTHTMVTDIKPESVTIRTGENTRTIPASTIVWAAGVKATPLVERLSAAAGLEADKSGRLIVANDCSLPQFPNVFVIGDAAHFRDDHQQQLPGIAPVAMQQGRYVAKLIARRMKNKRSRPFHYIDKGNLAVIGRSHAVASFPKLRFSGFVAWALWLFVHLLYLVGFENRVLVLVQWAFNYFTRNRSARLITNTTPSAGL